MPPELSPFSCPLNPLTRIRSVKPGGWVEFQDWDGYPSSADGSFNGTALQRYFDELNGAFEEAGDEVRPGPRLEQWFKDAGFVNIHVEQFVIPYGIWPKDPHLVSFNRNQLWNNPVLTSSLQKKVGAWNQAQGEANGCEGAALAALTRYKQWTKEEVVVLASQARADGRKRDIHSFFNL